MLKRKRATANPPPNTDSLSDFLSTLASTMTMTADKADAADNTPRAGGMGTEIIANNLPSYNEDDDAQRLEDVAELPFGNDAAEEHHSRSSKQTRSLFNFNKRTIILGSGIGAILLFFVAAAAGRKYQSNNNNSMVIESLNIVLPPRRPSLPRLPRWPSLLKQPLHLREYAIQLVFLKPGTKQSVKRIVLQKLLRLVARVAFFRVNPWGRRCPPSPQD